MKSPELREFTSEEVYKQEAKKAKTVKAVNAAPTKTYISSNIEPKPVQNPSPPKP